MNLALKEAQKTGEKGNFPIGSALTINKELIGLERNNLYTNQDWCSHAENSLIHKYSNLILTETKKGSFVELYSTLEPCFMCFGTALLHRIPRIVFGCHDPYGGITKLEQNNLPTFYKNRWPKIEGGLLAKQSYNLLVDFFKEKDTPEFREILEEYRKIKF